MDNFVNQGRRNREIFGAAMKPLGEAGNFTARDCELTPGSACGALLRRLSRERFDCFLEA
jgi:hypothetical protein